MAKKKIVRKSKEKSPRLVIPWDELRCICVVGDIGTGKTATCFRILDQIVNKPKYIYNHPQPAILSAAGVENLEELSLGQLSDCVLYIDEPQLHIGGGRDVKNLLKLYSLARQRDINIIFSTSDTRFITTAIESYIDCWVVKDIDYDTIKRGSKIKKIISELVYNVFPETVRLQIHEAILYCRKFLDKPKKITMQLPEYWSERFSKPYKEKLFDDVDAIFPYGQTNTVDRDD